MENTNGKADSGNTGAEENPSNHNNTSDDNDNLSLNGDGAVSRPQRTPFTDLSQVDADLALARTLQEQERAYMMLRIDGGGGGDYGIWEGESFGLHNDFDEADYDDASEEDYDASDLELDDDEENAFDEHANAEGEETDDQDVELGPCSFSNDGDYARFLQEVEERDITARLLALAGINERIVREDENEEDRGGNSQDAWEEVDPDELSYEELLALGEVIGTESRGLSAESITSLPSINYKPQGAQEGISDSCVICRLDYEDGDTLIVLSCKHSYHSECIKSWLQINKVCPVCSAEVSTSGMS